MSDSPASKKEDRAPRKTDSARRKVAVVQCNGFRCMAYQDNGKWHDYQTGEVLPEVLSIVLEFPV